MRAWKSWCSTSIPGGLTKGITEPQRQEIEALGRWAVDFAGFSLKLFDDIVLGNPTYVELILGDAYTHRTYYIGTVDDRNRGNFYDGRVRVVRVCSRRRVQASRRRKSAR